MSLLTRWLWLSCWGHYCCHSHWVLQDSELYWLRLWVQLQGGGELNSVLREAWPGASLGRAHLRQHNCLADTILGGRGRLVTVTTSLPGDPRWSNCGPRPCLHHRSTKS